jgi:hypothetical protein
LSITAIRAGYQEKHAVLLSARREKNQDEVIGGLASHKAFFTAIVCRKATSMYKFVAGVIGC